MTAPRRSTSADLQDALTKLRAAPAIASDRAGVQARGPDRRDGMVYLNVPQLPIEVALATGRPLLLFGRPGSGKSTVASWTARALGWRYYEHTVTARTEDTDLLWRFDAVRKLAAASTPRSTVEAELDDADFVDPGVLWWALDTETARSRGGSTRPASEPNHAMNKSRSRHQAVVLIDEIDKADPDVPNALLEPLGTASFTVRETGFVVSIGELGEADVVGRLLVVITSNGERTLPPAFVRRCVVAKLDPPEASRLVEIARAHANADGDELSAADVHLMDVLAKKFVALRDAAAAWQQGFGTAEFLDTVAAARSLNLSEADDEIEYVLKLTAEKQPARGA